MKAILTIFAILICLTALSQNSITDSNYIFWSKERRLNRNDFQIKVAHVASSYSYAQYSFDYKINGALFGLPKDYKKKIRNYFIKSASWIDTSYDVSTSIRYQQTLFDLAEIYVREFRKLIYTNRKKITWGKLKIDELNAEAMTAFSNRRVQYDFATNFGSIADKQKEWEILVANDLDKLKDFSSE